MGLLPPKAGYTQGAKDIFEVSYTHVFESNILQSVGNGGNLLYAAKARLDNLGAIKNQSCIVNEDRCMDRIVQRMEVSASIGDI